LGPLIRVSAQFPPTQLPDQNDAKKLTKIDSVLEVFHPSWLATDGQVGAWTMMK
jgi:hypothetical protein